MGRQFRIYLLPSDVARLVEILRHDVGLRLLASRSPRPEPIETESPVQTDSGFTRVDCLLAPDYAISAKLDHLAKQNFWSVNTLFSEVVEFSGCHFNEKTLKSGRLFYDKGFYRDEQWQEKSPRFLKWAEIVFKTAKKSIKRVPSLDAYIGEDAERWHSAGGLLVALSIKDHPPTGT
jgi:hypothetical protein